MKKLIRKDVPIKKTILVDEELHTKLKEYCRNQNLILRRVVQDTITEKITDKITDKINKKSK